MSASESEQETSMEESPVIKSRPIPKQEESEEDYESDESLAQDDGKKPVSRNEAKKDDDDDDDEDEEEEEQEENDDEESEGEDDEQDDEDDQPPIVTVQKTAAAKVPAIKPIAANRVQRPPHPTYYKMTTEAMTHLALAEENKRSGVTIAKIIKYIAAEYPVQDSKIKLFCKKAIEKGIKEEMYVKTTGVGFTGSINFTSKYRQKLRREQDKALKASEVAKKKPKAVPKTKPQTAKPKTAKAKTNKKPVAKKAPAKKADPKAVQSKPKKDSNNNAKTVPTKKTAPGPKATISKTTGKLRLSVGAKVAKKTVAKAKTAAAGASKVKPKPATTAAKPKKVGSAPKASKAKAAPASAK